MKRARVLETVITEDMVDLVKGSASEFAVLDVVDARVCK